MKTTFILSAFLFSQVLSWWENGHMLVSQIAELELKRSHPEVYERANDIVVSMGELSYDYDNTFVTAAVWPDDIKDKSMDFWDEWHFFDRAVNPEGEYIIQSESGKVNNAMDALERALEEFYGDQDAKDFTTQKAIFMRFVLHIVGDVHQPLHAVTMFNETYPAPLGDLAGNFLQIEDAKGVEMNLHAFWDQGAEYFQTVGKNPIERPFNESTAKFMEDWAKELIYEFPKSHFNKQDENMDFYEWTKESWRIASDQVYPLVYESNKLTSEYQEIGQQICKERATLAGYRLANFLELMLFKKDEAKQLLDTIGKRKSEYKKSYADRKAAQQRKKQEVVSNTYLRGKSME